MGVIDEGLAMQAMTFKAQGLPLQMTDLPIPTPGLRQVLIRVRACGVCRTDLHILDGELTDPKLPLVPGHQIIGTVVAMGEEVEQFTMGDRVGVPWLGQTCHPAYSLDAEWGAITPNLLSHRTDFSRTYTVRKLMR
jgi:D-arabinose 1-dehydrogenase-like Zn-dependent alcohol dehydrogenase